MKSRRTIALQIRKVERKFCKLFLLFGFHIVDRQVHILVEHRNQLFSILSVDKAVLIIQELRVVKEASSLDSLPHYRTAFCEVSRDAIEVCFHELVNFFLPLDNHRKGRSHYTTRVRHSPCRQGKAYGKVHTDKPIINRTSISRLYHRNIIRIRLRIINAL